MTEKRPQSPKRRGRPPLRPGKTKRASFTTRLTDDLKQRLERDAAAAGRSLSEEIESRLEKSFDRQDLLIEALGGEDVVPIMLQFRLMFVAIRNHYGVDRVWANPRSAYATLAAITGLFGGLQRRKPWLFSKSGDDGYGAGLGDAAAEFFIRVAALAVKEEDEELDAAGSDELRVSFGLLRFLGDEPGAKED